MKLPGSSLSDRHFRVSPKAEIPTPRKYYCGWLEVFSCLLPAQSFYKPCSPKTQCSTSLLRHWYFYMGDVLQRRCVQKATAKPHTSRVVMWAMGHRKSINISVVPPIPVAGLFYFIQTDHPFCQYRCKLLLTGRKYTNTINVKAFGIFISLFRILKWAI